MKPTIITDKQRQAHFEHLVNNLECDALLAATIAASMNRGDMDKFLHKIHGYIMFNISWSIDIMSELDPLFWNDFYTEYSKIEGRSY